MIKYITHELSRYWPITPELMAQYRDGDKPAYIGKDGHCEWYQNGKLHRDGDLPAVIDADGHLFWYQNGQLHREGDKPAKIFADGGLEWWQNDQLHRIGGPAVIYPSGRFAWWINGEYIKVESQEEFIEYLTKHNLIKDKGWCHELQ